MFFINMQLRPFFAYNSKKLNISFDSFPIKSRLVEKKKPKLSSMSIITFQRSYVFSFFSLASFIRIFFSFFIKRFKTSLSPSPWFFKRISIRRIKFKPGYIRIWKHAREELQLLWNLKFIYNKPLTLFLSRLRLFLYRLQNVYVNLIFVIANSFFSFLKITENDGIYINGFYYSKRWSLLISIAGDFFNLLILPISYIFLYKYLFLYKRSNFFNPFFFYHLRRVSKQRRLKSKFIKLFFFNVYYFTNSLLFEDISSLSFFFSMLRKKFSPSLR